jgi:hypothetical protein
MKDLYTPGNGKCQLNDKGDHSEHTGENALQNRPETSFTSWRRTVGFPSFGLAHEHARMPWKETRTVDQRLQFLSSYLK